MIGRLKGGPPLSVSRLVEIGGEPPTDIHVPYCDPNTGQHKTLTFMRTWWLDETDQDVRADWAYVYGSNLNAGLNWKAET